MIKAVIFDCFGVLTGGGWKQFREEYFAADPDLLQHSMDMDKAVNAGFLNYDDFLNEISALTDLPFDDVKKRLNGSVPNEMLFEFIKAELKPTMKIGMLSNAADNWLDQLFMPWQVELFDDVILSYETGAVKPDTQIYRTAITKLGVEFDEAIFIDDSERYVIAAEELGMKGIHHLDTRTTIMKIKELIRA
ncbi:MAG: HAD-superfamily hydrolase, subfamily variant 3 [Candidatus Saccharibacteria bacterium]|nr:HAD-superfamily hydrolase, subfamily variant 3 [Candidatus Saccharibacteria bacterium]